MSRASRVNQRQQKGNRTSSEVSDPGSIVAIAQSKWREKLPDDWKFLAGMWDSDAQRGMDMVMEYGKILVKCFEVNKTEGIEFYDFVVSLVENMLGFCSEHLSNIKTLEELEEIRGLAFGVYGFWANVVGYTKMQPNEILENIKNKENKKEVRSGIAYAVRMNAKNHPRVIEVFHKLQMEIKKFEEGFADARKDEIY